MLEVRTQSAADVVQAVGSVIRGKHEVVELAVVCLLSGGHLLLEDVPGTGKTSLARSLAHAVGVDWSRVQFTPDLLPSDITGTTVLRSGEFTFRPGPVFCSILLADEVNRASPRTQSALLEAMEERQVSVDGVTHPLPSPFMVIATQNPVDMAGTFALPEAQLDRFLIRTSLGYPSHDDERAILAALRGRASLEEARAAVDQAGLVSLIDAARAIEVPETVQDYIVRITAATRVTPGVSLGASPRGSIALQRASQARALLDSRQVVTPGDVQGLAVPVLAHRLVLDADALALGRTAEQVIADVVAAVPAPQSA